MRTSIMILVLLAAATVSSAASLPLIEVPATAGTSDTLVVLVSGDGGWASIDRSLSAVLARKGMPVVGLDALQYFWTKRTPDAASRDLQAIIDAYTLKWKKQRVVLIGYSRGADVLPAMTARLAAETQSKLRLLALLSPSPTVEFHFHVIDWLHDSKSGLPVRPEVEKLRVKTLCIWGSDDKDSLCRNLALPQVKVITLAGSHHFDGDYERLANLILQELP